MPTYYGGRAQKQCPHCKRSMFIESNPAPDHRPRRRKYLDPGAWREFLAR